MANLNGLIITDDSFLSLPKGTTSERPNLPNAGYLRLNLDENSLESFTTSTNSWFEIDKKLDVFTNGLVYRAYNTQTLYGAQGHADNNSELDNFFNSARSDVSFIDSGMWYGEVNWGSSLQAGTIKKPPYLPADGFSWMVEGYIYAPETGTYFFGCDGDDAMDVYMNNNRVAYWYGGHGFSGSWTSGSGQVSSSINLTEGVYYPFRARVEEGGGGDGMKVGWRKPSDASISLVPASSFFVKV